MRLNSLALRLFATSAAWTLLVLPLAGYIIYSLYREDVQLSFDAQLKKLLTQITIDSMSTTGDEPVMPPNLYEPLFEVTQSGPLRTRFHVVPHSAESIGKSVARTLPYAVEPQLHVLRSAGTASASLFDIEAEGLLLTGVEREDSKLRLFLLNTEDSNRILSLKPATLTPRAARLIDLEGKPKRDVAANGGAIIVDVAARAWVGVEIDV